MKLESVLIGIIVLAIVGLWILQGFNLEFLSIMYNPIFGSGWWIIDLATIIMIVLFIILIYLYFKK